MPSWSGSCAADLRFFSYWIGAVFAAERGGDGLRRRLVEVCDEAEEAVRGGASIVVLSDREVDADQAPIPMLLAVGAVHHRLIETGLRMDASIVVVSAEPRDSHDLACLIGFGASAVNPYLAIEQCRALAEADEIAVGPSRSPRRTTGRRSTVGCSRSCRRWGSALSPRTGAASCSR